MRDYINIGATPAEEDCAQVGSPDYSSRARVECQRFIELIRKTLGPEPEGARLATKSFPHDFGGYFEGVCYFDDQDEEARKYAFRSEREAPTRWDGASPNGKAPVRARLCDSCREAGEDQIADDDMAEIVMLELGADLPDHLCDQVETHGAIRCACACRNGR